MSGRDEAAPAPTKGRVLVVDDELALGRACARSLEHGGHQVVVATDGVRAAELLEGGGFDVLVCDVWMPGMTGVDLLRAVRARDTGLHVVLLTGTPKAEDAEAAAESGALMYLVKPIELRVLLQVVDHAWRLGRRGVALALVAQEGA